MASTKTTNSTPLSDIVEALRNDLVQSAEHRPAGWEPLFEVTEATVEVQVVFERNKEVKGGLKAYVVDISAGGAEKSTSGHKVTLKLVPAAAGLDPTDDRGPMFRGSR